MRPGFGGVLVAAALAAGSAHAACKIKVFGDLPLQPDTSRALVLGAVNDKPVVFIVDTGAWMSSMPFPDARRLAVKVDVSNALTSEGIGGTVATGLGHFNMKLGKLDLPHEQMTVLAMPSLDHQAVALVGLDLLDQHDIELNLPENNIKLEAVEGCATAELAYWNKPYSLAKLESDGSLRPTILVNVLLNGHVVPAEIDSGSPQSVDTPAAARMAGADLATAEKTGEIRGVGVHKIAAEVARFDTFTLGDETIKNVKLIVSEMWKYNKVDETGTRLGSHTHSLEQPRMLLGADFLRAHRVLVANSMHLMVFSYMGGPVFDISQATPQAPPPPAPHQTASSQSPTPTH